MQLLQGGLQRCLYQLSVHAPCPFEPFLEDQGQHQNRTIHRYRHHRRRRFSKLFGPPFRQVLLSRSLSSWVAQQAQAPPPL